MTPKTSNPSKIPFESSFALELIEYPFVTLKKFPRGYIQRFGKYKDFDEQFIRLRSVFWPKYTYFAFFANIFLGGLVSCRSVKLLEGQGHEEEEDLRYGWWTEIRREIRSHARALCCNLIVGYTEDTVIS